eukprot:30176-Rhodomonas_salina.1
MPHATQHTSQYALKTASAKPPRRCSHTHAGLRAAQRACDVWDRTPALLINETHYEQGRGGTTAFDLVRVR